MFYGHLAIAKLLIDKRANYMAIDCIQMNWIHYAVDGGHLSCIEYALRTTHCEPKVIQKETLHHSDAEQLAKSYLSRASNNLGYFIALARQDINIIFISSIEM